MRILHGPGRQSDGMPEDVVPVDDPEGVCRWRRWMPACERILVSAYNEGWTTSFFDGKRLRRLGVRRDAPTSSPYLAAWWKGYDDERSTRDEA